MKAARPGQFMFITRQQAARLLRAARDSRADNIGERIGWALAALKDSRHAQRLKIDYLLGLGNFDSADAMLARHLLTGREHPLMRLRFARSMFLQGRLDSAWSEISRVIVDRPDHIGARLLAASIAGARGEHDRAVEFLIVALDQRPTCHRVRTRLIEALLDAGLVRHAERELACLTDPPAVLQARVLRASGRTVDALHVLREAVKPRSGSTPKPDVIMELLDVSEDVGDVDQLTRLHDWLQRDAVADTAEWAEVRDRAAAACRRTGLSNESLADIESIIAKGRDGATPADDARIARQWLGRLLEQLLVEQADAAASGADPSPNLLPPLLEQAAATLNRHLAGRETTDREFEPLRQHRDLIHHTLGRTG